MAYAYETVPYYREVMDQAGLRPTDFQTADDLAQLPLLTSEQVARAPERFVSCRYRQGQGLQMYSSGTSGHAKNVHYDPTALFLALAHGHRQRRVLTHFVGRTFGYREAGVAVETTVSRKIREFYETHSWTPRGVDLSRAFVVLGKAPLAELIAQLNAFQPEVIRGYGSALGMIYRWARDHNMPIVRPKALVYGADHMAIADRQLIEATYGVPVLSTYQAVEALRIAFQCEYRAGFHVSLDAVAIRIVDDTGRTLGPNAPGHLVLSNLTNRATVLLNYKLGDVVTWSTTACPCGRTLPTLERIEGRSDDRVLLPDGRRLHALAVLEPLDGIPGLVQVQLVQEELQRFALRAVCTDEIPWEPMCQQLTVALRPVLGQDSVLAVEQVEAIRPGPGGKVRAVISHYEL
jgi:phenylacetate-CoA ligase